MGQRLVDRGHLRASSVILNGELGLNADGLVPEQELRERLGDTPGLAERLRDSLVLVTRGERPVGGWTTLQGLAAPILAPPDRLAPASVVVGRGPPAQVCLRLPAVSSAHLTFQRGPRGWTCVDRSTNGTTLNGRRLSAGEAVPVGQGDLIGLSEHVWLAVHTPASLLHGDPEQVRAMGLALAGQGGAFSGRIEGSELLELLQLLSLDRRSGTILLAGPTWSGHLQVADGCAVGAELLPARGLDAARQLVARREGGFTFRPADASESSAGSDACRVPLETLLMDAARALDEAGGPKDALSVWGDSV